MLLLLLLCYTIILLGLHSTLSYASKIVIRAGDPSLRFSENWNNRGFSGGTFQSVDQLGTQLEIFLPPNSTRMEYTGFKLPTGSLYGICIDDPLCSRPNATNASDPNANSESPPSVLFTVSVDPVSPHNITITNLKDTRPGISNVLTFVSLTVTTTTSESPVAPVSSTTSAPSDSATESTLNSLSASIIALTVLGSVSLLVGLILFLYSSRQRRLRLMQQYGGVERGEDGIKPPTSQVVAHQGVTTTIAPISRFNTIVSQTISTSPKSSQHKPLPDIPLPSRPPSAARSASAARSTSAAARASRPPWVPGLPSAPGPREVHADEAQRLRNPNFFRPSFLDFDEKSDGSYIAGPTPSRFSSSTVGHPNS